MFVDEEKKKSFHINAYVQLLFAIHDKFLFILFENLFTQ